MIRARQRRGGGGSVWLGAVCVCVLALGLALSGVAFTHDPSVLDIGNALAAPSGAHWLGTDHLGRDVASHLLAGTASTLGVALFAVGLGGAVGVPLGLFAASVGGWVEDVVMRANDLVFAFPALILAILLAAALGPGGFNAALAIGIFNVPVFARVARGGARALWAREFVLAAQAAGKSRLRISLEHIAPNLADVLIVQAVIQLSLGVIAESGLSYVGLGVQAPTPSWGRMLAEAQTYAFLSPWLAIGPAIAIVFTVLGFGLLGEGLRDMASRRKRLL